MSIGGIMDIKWANERRVSCGGYCDVQGALQFIGETSVAMFTLAVAAHTFVSVIKDKRIKYRPMLWGAYMGFVWLFVFFFAVINWAMKGAGDGRFFAPTGHCEY